MSRSGLSRPATYTEGAIRDHVAKLSSVMILGFLAMTVGQLIEIFYIGKVGKAELAAVTFMFPISMSLNALTRGIGIGAATLIAQSMGAGDREQTAMTVTHCYILVLIFTIAVSLVGQFGASYLFILLGASDQVLVLATHYAKIWLIGFPMMGLAMVSNGLIRSFGNPTFPGFIMTIAPVVQVIVGPFLIFGWAGLPMLGLEEQPGHLFSALSHRCSWPLTGIFYVRGCFAYPAVVFSRVSTNPRSAFFRSAFLLRRRT